MRKRLNTAAAAWMMPDSQARPPVRSMGADHGLLRFAGAEKKKTRRWERRVRFFVIGVYGFKYAAWLVLVTPESAERLFCYCPADLLFLFFYFLVLL
jgi:hypothetical protein